jgi:hypothetical protein
MQPLPMIRSACSLDDDALEEQLGRYARLGTPMSLGARRIEIAVAPETTDEAIDTLIKTEQSCCPFFELDYDAGTRRLTIAVGEADREPALAAIAAALSPRWRR